MPKFDKMTCIIVELLHENKGGVQYTILIKKEVLIWSLKSKRSNAI